MWRKRTNSREYSPSAELLSFALECASVRKTCSYPLLYGAELEAEIATLTDLEALAEEVRASGTDRKWRSSRAFCRTTRPCLTRAVCARS